MICSGEGLESGLVDLASFCPVDGGHIYTAKLIIPLLAVSSDTMRMCTLKEGKEGGVTTL